MDDTTAHSSTPVVGGWSRYVYPALRPLHIRILVLQPSFDRDAPLKFTFDEVNIWIALGDFEAVSYTWGEPNLTFPLHHDNGSRIWVTKNLDLALRRLRKRLDNRRLWADAVCIDQLNLEEKAMRIPLMNWIYRGATRVLVYLEPGGEHDEQGMQVLIRASQARKSSRFAVSEVTSRQVGALSDLPWFRRFWTVQESVLNVDVTLLCGRSEITLVRLIQGLRVFQKNNTKFSGVLSSAPGVRAAERTAELWKRCVG